MNKNFRRILLISSMTFFAGLAPLMVLYAMGYRLSPTSETAESVGVILVESIPRRASLYINGKYRGLTPRAASNLTPGTHAIQVTHDGYITWEKNIPILPGKVSDFRSILLFPQNPTYETFASDVKHFSLSPNRSLIATLSSDATLTIYDHDQEVVVGPIALATDINRLLWSPDSNSILLLGTGLPAILDLTASTPQPSALAITDPLADITWDQRIPGRLIYQDQTGGVYAYHYPSDSRQKITSAASSIATSSSYLYAAYPDQIIKTYDLRGDLNSTIETHLESPITRLMVTPGDRIGVLTENNEFYIYLAPKFVKISDQVSKAGWSPDERLVYLQTNPNSIYVYNHRDDRLDYLPLKSSTLVLRLSRPIEDPQWFAGGRHLLYQLGDEIHVTEIDIRDRPHDYVLDSTNLGNSRASVGEAGREIYYLKQNSDTTNLMRVPLLPEQESFFDFLP